MLCCNMQGRHSILLSLFFLFAAATHTARATTADPQHDPLCFARKHPEYINIPRASKRTLSKLAHNPLPENLYAEALLQKNASLELPTNIPPIQNKNPVIFAVALFCLVTDIHSSQQPIADCPNLNFTFYQNALYMIYHMLLLLPASTWDDPHLQTTLNNLHSIQYDAFRVLPFTAAACTTITLLKYKQPTAQNLTEFLNPTTNSPDQHLILAGSFKNITQLFSHCDRSVYRDSADSMPALCTRLFASLTKHKNPDPKNHLFLNLGCAPFIFKIRCPYTRMFPNPPLTWFTTYTTHLTNQLPHTTNIKMPEFAATRDLSSKAYLCTFIRHHLPLKQANTLCAMNPKDYPPLYANDYSPIYDTIVPDGTPYSLSLRLLVLAEQLKRRHPTPVWLEAHPSLIQFFGPYITMLDSANAKQSSGAALSFITRSIEQMSNILNNQNNFLPNDYILLNAIDHFYAYGPTRWLFLLTQVLGATLYAQLEERGVQELSRTTKQAILQASWPNQPNFSRFVNTWEASDVWERAFQAIKDFNQSDDKPFLPPAHTPIVLKKSGKPTQATDQGIRALLFWQAIETMANKIQKHGYTAVSYQEVGDLWLKL